MLNVQEQTILDAITPVAVTSSTDATPIVVTATSHGLANGDRVLIYGHTTNIAANGIFKVANKAANTFELVDELTGANIAGSAGGAGSSGICLKAPAVLLSSDYDNAEVQINTSGTATTTLKIVGSVGKPASVATTSPRYDYPNLGATVSPSNPYSFLGSYDLNTGGFKDGATGIVTTATDLAAIYKVNTSGQKYLTVIPTSWSAGAITIKVMLSSIS